MKRTLVIVVSIALALALVMPGIVGVLAQERHKRQIEMTMQESPHIEMVADEYDRGWFNSRGRYRVELSDKLEAFFPRETGMDNGQRGPVTLVIDSRLHHGPFALATALDEGGTFLPVLATVESKLSIVSGDETLLELPGTVITNIHLTGGGTARYAYDRLTLDNEGKRFTSDGAEIAVNFNASATRVDGEGKLEGLHFEDPKGRLEMNPVTFSWTQSLTDFGFWAGETLLKMPAATYAGQDVGDMALRGLQVQYAVRMPEEYVVASAELVLQELEADAWRAGPAVLSVELARADPVAFGRLTQALQNTSAGAKPAAGAGIAESSGELSALLAEGAIFDLHELRVQTPDGEVLAKLHLEFPENAAVAKDAMLALGGLVAELDLRLPKAVVAAAGAADPQSGQYVQLMLDTGFIQAQGDYYVTHAAYKGGLLTVNGIPLPLPFGGALPPQAIE
ncbi:MAG: YdgA family protein [Gammaproteobacteria bacterium]|nr:YdgA family protein [Gammaproteobacteria bacterium]